MSVPRPATRPVTAGAGGATGLVRGLLIALLVARLLHPIAMFAPKNAPTQFVCRRGGILGAFAVLAAAAVALT